MLSRPHAGMPERQARFEALYAANHAPILGYALRRTANPDDAADILSETFLTAWRRLDEDGFRQRVLDGWEGGGEHSAATASEDEPESTEKLRDAATGERNRRHSSPQFSAN